MACHEPEESCFCKAFGIDCAEPAADVATWMVEGELYWKALTEKGGGTDQSSRKPACGSGWHRCRKAGSRKTAIRTIVEKTSILQSVPGRMERRRTDRKIQFSCMEELYKPCLACGTCTFVCPTCQCYDIKDYDTGHGVKRYRCWDSCMYPISP